MPDQEHIRPRGIERYAWRHPQLASQARIPPLLQQGLAASARTVLDMGCGEGATISAVSEHVPEAEIVGCDLSEFRCKTAYQRAAVVALADCQRLPVGDDTIDLVISRHVIEHVVDDAALLTEARRVLRPGGYLYLETPLRLRGAWYPYRNAEGRFVLDPTHIREYTTTDEVTRLVHTAQLSVVAVETHPIRYQLAHLAHRLFRPRHRAASDDRSPGWTLPIPRYRELRLLATTST